MKKGIRCEAEIGSIKKGWHSCNAPAVCISVTTRLGIYLAWCHKHRSRGEKEGRKIVKEL